ncbi:hypothetical protein GCM10025857_07300 [Alicyclobacillus contaminans]|uniref:helix-turn-helix domain-containing protein n=1 Tax=Alicyclobacillus contaminans TaxID=392016 RepID=UPI000A018179|nr:helix-turn-helix transcriptional regulator [Alicyclobacillus contaminans]GMA49373.1 hypothetical protein GCM10025857_07300 [Alicyclobacillus contaminans]
MYFGERLKFLREQRGWTQEDLAQRLGVSRDAIAGYEARGKTPRSEKLIMIARLFDTSIDYLFGLTDDPTPPKRNNSERNETCNTKEEESIMKGNHDHKDQVDIPVQRLAAHLEGEYGEYDPEMAQFLHGIITEVLQDYKEFKRRQAERKKDADG